MKKGSVRKSESVTKKRNLRPIRFKGFDWTELGQVFGIEVPIPDEGAYAYIIKDRLWKAAMVSARHVVGDYRLAKFQIKQARRYLLKVAECDLHYDGKVWYEIAVLKDDETFVKWLTAFLEAAWT